MRKVAVFTGNRAEYGLLYPIIRAIDEHPQLEVYLLASGAHLDEDFGKTVAEIEADGLSVHREVRIDMDADTLHATAQAIGSGARAVSTVLDELRPDLFVVYADRFEGFAAVIAGTQMGIPTAHIEGGDITEGGALDDSVRHAMTKLSHLHFTTNADATRRVKAMGEEEWRVHDVGFSALDLISSGRIASAEELVERYGLDPERPLVVFTQHSVATEFKEAAGQARAGLDALARVADEAVQAIITYPNNDAGGRRIIDEIHRWLGDGIENVQVHRSMGRWNYHGALWQCGHGGWRGVCAGNSSSGIKETPACGCPAVNIGTRQAGRLRADNVIDVAYDTGAIEAALRRALFDDDFRAACRTCDNPYGGGDSGARIADVLAEVELGPRLVQKRMTV